MNYIIKSGLSSKNTPISSWDSLLLTLNQPGVDGVCVRVHYTKDKELVVYHEDTFFNQGFSNLSYLELQKYNIGNRIRKRYIMTLDEVCKLFEGRKEKLILQLEESNDNQDLFLKDVTDCVNRYPNISIYLKSSNPDMVLALSHLTNHKVGTVISSDYDYLWNMDLDFYTILLSKIPVHKCISRIVEKLEAGVPIFLEGNLGTIGYYYQEVLADYDNVYYLLESNQA